MEKAKKAGDKDPLLERIGSKFKQIRIEKNITQEVVTNDTNINIIRIEGASINTTIGTINKLCEYYGVSLQTFFEGM